MTYLVARFDLEQVMSLDPDIFVYSRSTPVFERLREASAVLTPHITTQ